MMGGDAVCFLPQKPPAAVADGQSVAKGDAAESREAADSMPRFLGRAQQ